MLLRYGSAVSTYVLDLFHLVFLASLKLHGLSFERSARHLELHGDIQERLLLFVSHYQK